MTSPDDADQPAASPADEAAVRRLLADARATDPVPPEVVTRLDETLAGLVADRETPPEVADLAARRRRRAAGLLVAAAAVVVGGLVVGHYAGGGGDHDASTASDAAVARDRPEAAAERDQSGAEPSDGNTSTLDSTLTDGFSVRAAPGARVRPDHLMADVVALRRSWRHDVAPSAYGSTAAVLPRGIHCATAPWGHGVLLGVRYGGRPAVVAFRAPQGDTQVVEVLQCGTADVLRSTTIPAR